jgi:hypothetical protein
MYHINNTDLEAFIFKTLSIRKLRIVNSKLLSISVIRILIGILKQKYTINYSTNLAIFKRFVLVSAHYNESL